MFWSLYIWFEFLHFENKFFPFLTRCCFKDWIFFSSLTLISSKSHDLLCDREKKSEWECPFLAEIWCNDRTDLRRVEFLHPQLSELSELSECIVISDKKLTWPKNLVDGDEANLLADRSLKIFLTSRSICFSSPFLHFFDGFGLMKASTGKQSNDFWSSSTFSFLLFFSRVLRDSTPRFVGRLVGRSHFTFFINFISLSHF